MVGPARFELATPRPPVGAGPIPAIDAVKNQSVSGRFYTAYRRRTGFAGSPVTQESPRTRSGCEVGREARRYGLGLGRRAEREEAPPPCPNPSHQERRKEQRPMASRKKPGTIGVVATGRGVVTKLG